MRRNRSRFHTIRLRGGVLKGAGLLLSLPVIFLLLLGLLSGDEKFINTEFMIHAFEKSIPSFGGAEKEEATELNLEALPYVCLSGSMPVIESNSGLAKKYSAIKNPSLRVKRNTQDSSKKKETLPKDPVPDQNGKPVKEMDMGEKDNEIQLRNETDYNIDINGLLAKPLQFQMDTGGPKVLIVHTHTSEAYAPSPEHNYTPTDNVRTEDSNFNVVQVGNEVAKALEKNGVEVVHDKSLNDYPSYNGSYTKTLGVIEDNLKKYPTIEVVLDVHRDFTEQADGTQLKPTIMIDGKKAAQMMLVVGTNAMGLSHDNWRHNLSFALDINQKLNQMYPGLVRCVNIRNERFNQHETKGSLILEMGSQANTLDEAMRTGEYVGNGIAAVLNKK